MNKAETRTELETRFWSKVNKKERDECWNWLAGGYKQDGYGRFGLFGKCEKSNRVAFYLTNGYFPDFVLHTCNNKLCCNPNHLYDGTRRDNVLDMMRAGTFRSPLQKGEKHPQAKLKKKDVIRILTMFFIDNITKKEIASIMKVNRCMIYNITLGRTWTEVYAAFMNKSTRFRRGN